MHSFVLGGEDRGSPADVVEQILPTLRDLDGYRGIVVLADREDDRIVSVSLWESAEAMDASRAVTEKIRQAETTGRDIESQEPSTYRVIAFDLHE